MVTGHNFERIPPKNHPCYVCFKLADWFQKRRLLNNFPIGFYVKTMSADGGHFEPRSGSLYHNFGSWPPKDHRWHACYIGLLVSEEKILKHFFPLGPMLKLQYVCWKWPSWMEVRITGHNFENWPLKDHPCHVCFKLAYWFQRRRFLNIFPIGSYVKTMFADGGHLEFPISKRFTILVQDHPMIIPAKPQFNWLSGF